MLQHIKIERTADGWIALTGTDLDRFVTMRLEHPADGPPVAVLVPYDQLVQLSRNCGRDERLLIESTPQGPLIKFALADKLGEAKVKLIPVAEFPLTPRIQCDAIALPPAVKNSIREAMACAAMDDSRRVLNGAYIDTSNPKAGYIVGTDGKHLYSANSFTLPLKHPVLIPNHKFVAWKEFVQDGEWQMKADDTAVQLSSRRWRVVSKQIPGAYPNWRATVPSPDAARTHVTLDSTKLDALMQLIQRMPCHDPDRFQTIGLEWKQGQFLLLGRDNGNEKWTRVPVADAKGDGGDVTIFLSRKLLLKALSYGLNVISLIDDVSPLRFHAQGRQMIVMPLRSNGSRNDTPSPNPPPVPVPAPRLVPRPAAPVTTPATPSPPMNQPASSEPSNKSPVEEVIAMTFQLRDTFNAGFGLLRDLSQKLKVIHRDHKASAREFDTVRSTLRSLQGMKL